MMGLPRILDQLRLAAVLCLLLLFAAAFVGKLKAERRLAETQGRLALAEERLSIQNRQIEGLRAQAERRKAEQSALLGQARQANERQSDLIERLRQSAQALRPGADCGISDVLRQTEGML